MNKEKLIQFISEAIDQGARIDIILHGFNTSREQAEEASQQFNGIVGGETEEIIRDGATWFRTGTEEITFNQFYRNNASHFMEEDVDLSGGVENAS